MTRPRWIVPAFAGLLIIAAAMWASAGQSAGADSPLAPAQVLAADVKTLPADADSYIDTVDFAPKGLTSQTLQVQDYLGREATRRTLLHFTLTGQIPANATIVSAVLELYLESGSDLYLLPGVPRQWLEDGKKLEIDGMFCYFGRLRLNVESCLAQGVIRASVEIAGDGRGLKRVFLRLPHPQGRRLQRYRAEAGCEVRLDAENERVIIEPWHGEAVLTLEYA